MRATEKHKAQMRAYGRTYRAEHDEVARVRAWREANPAKAFRQKQRFARAREARKKGGDSNGVG